MKVRMTPCLQCEAEKAEKRYYVAEADLLDDLTFALECPSGHKTRLIYEAQKFEILFDMGASALLDGYSREAVSSFAAAQERFHEFCIEVFLRSGSVPKEAFAQTWKAVANQSERQFGAYLFLRLMVFKTPLSKKETTEVQDRATFRNNVIHKGYIPTRDEAVDYATYVYDYIVRNVIAMKAALAVQIEEVCTTDLADLKASIPAGMLTRSAAVPTLIWLSGPADKFGKRTFAEGLQRKKEDHLLELQDRIEKMEDEQNEEDD